MKELATQADRARRGLLAGNIELIGDAMNRSFDLRVTMVDVGDHQRRLVATGRELGAWVNSAGSGGSVVGLVADPDALVSVRAAYRGVGAEFLDIA